jgi:hypothetical protein
MIPIPRLPRLPTLGAVVVVGCAATGCLGDPPLEDRWTRLDFDAVSLTPYQFVQPGVHDSVTVRARVTFRTVLTGVAVVELRRSTTVGVNDVTIHPEANRLAMARDVDRVLAESVTLGRSTRAFTGWDHLIQTFEMDFRGALPASGDSLAGLFLLCYLGEGDEVERRDGSDTLIVTPFPSEATQILPVGMELRWQPAGGAP